MTVTEPLGPGEPEEAMPAAQLADGVPPVVADAAALARAVAALSAGRGPVAVDAERASGYRYSQRAYLVQLRREGSGTVLIDPIGCPDLGAVNSALRAAEWVLHAAGQDLPCLAEVGLAPETLFDTELAARLAGYERVGLAALAERLLGMRLDKEHSAADWSTRPLPASWLRYAALDVELLVSLRDLLRDELEQAGKLDWARQEFQALLTAPPAAPRSEPWRRLSGIHRLRRPRQLAVARALWTARDTVARQRDRAPGRVLPDAAIVDVASQPPAGPRELAALPVYRGPRLRQEVPTWWRAIEEALALPDAALPRVGAADDGGPPPAARWAEREPAAAVRLQAVRQALNDLAELHRVPVANLLEPALSRRLAWEPPSPPTPSAVAQTLAAGRARPWQVELVADALSAALSATLSQPAG